MAKKYEFTGATKEHHGVTVRQIRAIVVIAGVVETGGVGGWIESEKCLDHTGDAWVSGNAWVSGDAWVESKDAICWFSGFGSECRTTTAFIDKKLGIRIVCGCFTGSTVEFRKEVIETHGEYSKHGRLYIDMAHMIESRLDAIS